MGVRMATIGGLVAAGVAAFLLLRSEGAGPGGEGHGDRAAAGAHRPDLVHGDASTPGTAGSGDRPDRGATLEGDGRVPVPATEAASATWQLVVRTHLVHSRIGVWPPAIPIEFEPPSAAAPRKIAPAGTALEIVAVRGTHETPLGRVVLDATGVGRLDIGALAAWTPLRRHGTHLVARSSARDVEIHPGTNRGTPPEPRVEVPRDAAGAPWALEMSVGILAGHLVRGTCVDDEGRPAEGVHVELRPPDNAKEPGQGWPQACTDAQGRFVISAEQDGRFVLHLSNPLGVLDSTHRRVDVPTGGVDVGTLELSATGVVKGHVLLSDGTPLPGIEVTQTGEWEWHVSWFPPARPGGCEAIHPTEFAVVRTRADGSFRLPTELLAKDVQIDVRLPAAYGVTVEERARVADPLEEDRDWIVHAHRLVVTVVDADGVPAPDATFQVVGEAGTPAARKASEPVARPGVAGPDGTFTVLGAPGSVVRIAPIDVVGPKATRIVLPKHVGTTRMRIVVTGLAPDDG